MTLFSSPSSSSSLLNFNLSCPCYNNFPKTLNPKPQNPIIKSKNFNTNNNSTNNVVVFQAKKLKKRTKALNLVSETIELEPVQAEITWQIIVGALAGVTPFIVAGIEFSKRIAAQRRCEVCGGSGLVLRDKYYFKCPSCGGFLPWQSWKRFFTG